ncbi:hypothetical protein GCM10012286_49310 [Streptomyces lasiicapitis]|uniref:Uncharacterized protein n=1 Tax=Streptomyces lasiicapitis TaxID=1923961 RepID=A0ABQ2MEB2_9ACTN|nr:hypothetical protein GCM10012286_49310 [Streptomyces lasiicapitis]
MGDEDDDHVRARVLVPAGADSGDIGQPHQPVLMEAARLVCVHSGSPPRVGDAVPQVALRDAVLACLLPGPSAVKASGARVRNVRCFT